MLPKEPVIGEGSHAREGSQDPEKGSSLYDHRESQHKLHVLTVGKRAGSLSFTDFLSPPRTFPGWQAFPRKLQGPFNYSGSCAAQPAGSVCLLCRDRGADSLGSPHCQASSLCKAREGRRECQDFPGGPVGKNLPANAGDSGLIPGPGRSHMLQRN